MLGRVDETFRELYRTDFPANYCHLSDACVDEMADKVLTEKDPARHLRDSHGLRRCLAEIVPRVSLYVPDLVIVYNKNLKGTYLFGGGNHQWNHACASLEG